jgi:hypothetical protein
MSDESLISQIADTISDVIADGKIDNSDIARVVARFVVSAPEAALPIAAAAIPGGGAALDAASKVGLDPAKLIGRLKALKKN